MDFRAWLNKKPVSERVPGFLERYSDSVITKATLAAFDDLASSLKTAVDDSEALIRADICPVEWLDYLAALAGFTEVYWRKDYPVSFKRLMISKANWIFSNKGSKEVLEYVLTSYGIQNQITIDSDFIIGLSKVGDPIGFLPFQFVIYINPRQENIEELKKSIPEFVRLYAPIWCTYKIIEDYNRFAFFAFIGFTSAENLIGIGSIDNQSRKLLIESIGLERSSNPLSTFSQTTINYRNNLLAVGFTDDLGFFNALDQLLVKPIENSLPVSDIGLLSLFVGSTAAEQRVNLYGPTYATFEGGTALENGYQLTDNEFLSVSITLPVDSLISAQVLNANISDVKFLYSTDNGNFLIDKVGQELAFDNGVQFEYLDAGNNGFNVSTINRDLHINGFEVTKATLGSGVINGIKIGSNAAETIFFNGTIRYFLALKKINIGIDNLILNFFNAVGSLVPTAISRYHPKIIEYRQKLINNVSNITDSNLAAFNAFIRNLYNADLLNKLEYALPFSSNGFEGVRYGFLADVETANNITVNDYTIQNGLLFGASNSKWLELFETVNSQSFLSGSRTYFLSSKFSKTTTNDTGYFGCGNNSQRFGLFQSGDNSDRLKAFFGFYNFTCEAKVTLDREIVIAQHQNLLSGKIFQNGNQIASGIIQSGNMQSQKIRIGSVIIDNVLQANQNTFQGKFFCKFVNLSETDIVIVSGLINQFNRDINRA